jgi:DNA-binding MarR family transcriptional regulator
MEIQDSPESEAAQYLEIAASCVCFNLRRAARAVTSVFESVLRPSGLHITQFTMLVVLRLRGTAPLNEVAELMGMDRTTLTRNLVPLESRGLVSTEQGNDRRTRLITLTPAGQSALSAALPLWTEAQAQAVSALGEATWRALMPSLGLLSMAEPGMAEATSHSTAARAAFKPGSDFGPEDVREGARNAQG